MDGHVDLIAHLDPGQIHERSIENDALRISDLRNGLRHDVILCFTNRRTSNADPGSLSAASRCYRACRSPRSLHSAVLPLRTHIVFQSG